LEIEHHLVQVCQPNHFHQCEGTPLTMLFHKENLGEDGCTPWCNRLLKDKSWDSTGALVDTLWTWLLSIKGQEISAEVTVQDLRHVIQLTKENISSSPLGLHYGDYKSLTSFWLSPDKSLVGQADQILDMIVFILNQAITLDFSLSHWQKLFCAYYRKFQGISASRNFALFICLKETTS